MADQEIGLNWQPWDLGRLKPEELAWGIEYLEAKQEERR